MSYAIFRSEPVYKLNDLGQIGSHNKREKSAYKSNPDIKLEKTKDNIDIVPLQDKYIKGFYNITIDYKKEHDLRMETMREDRKKSFTQMVNDSKSVVADELLFTSDNDFFKNMDRHQIKKWAETCMEFVYQDLGYNKEQILHSVVHMDEKTPHLHCVVIPLVKKLDKRTNTIRYSISKKQYIKDMIHLSELQDKYHARMVSNGYDLDRGIKNSDNEHLNIKELKKITRKLNLEMETKNKKLSAAIEELEVKVSTNKETMFDKEYVKIKKDTFDSMNKVIIETKKIAEIQPKLEKVYNEVDTCVKNYKGLIKENDNIKKEVKYLKIRNDKLEQENSNLISYIKSIFKAIKSFLRELLLRGNKEVKQATSNEIKEYYDNDEFDRDDVYDIAVDTDKEEELFEYADISRDYRKKEDYDMKF